MSVKMRPVLHLMHLVRECRVKGARPEVVNPLTCRREDCPISHQSVIFRRKVGIRNMSTDFALSLVDVRLVQTARLLQSLVDDDQLDGAAVKRALHALQVAHGEIKDLRAVSAG